jgi:hypothetical protein
MNKKIETDKIIQTGRAVAGARPTDDATVAGYRAHAAVALKSQMLGAQSRLNALAKDGLDDEQWEEAVQAEYTQVDQYLLDNYSNYNTDKDMQKLLPLAFREAMPQITATREADKIEREEISRINDASDALINLTSLAKKNGQALTTDVIVNQLDMNIKGQQFTSLQKDKIFTNAILTTKDPSLIEASKSWKGDRKSSLYSRTGSIQELEKKLNNEALLSQSLDFEVAQAGISNKFMSGEFTEEEMLGAVKQLRKQSGDKWPGRGFVTTLLTKKNKAVQADAANMATVKALLEGDSYANKDKTTKEMELAFDTAMRMQTEVVIDQVNEQMPDADDTAKAQEVANLMSGKSMMILQRAVEQGHVPNSIKIRINQIARINLGEEGNIVDAQDDKGFVHEKLAPAIQGELRFLQSIPEPIQEGILQSLERDTRPVIEGFWNHIAAGDNTAIALEKAQRQAANPRPHVSSDIQKAAEKITSDMQAWFKTDLTDNQEPLVQNHVAELLYNSVDPTSELTQRRILKNVEGYGRTRSGRIFIGMTSDAVKQAMCGLDSSHWDGVIESLIKNNADRLKPILDPAGLKMKDVTVLPVPEQGYFRLVDKTGALLSAKRFRFQDAVDQYDKETYKREKKILDWNEVTTPIPY